MLIEILITALGLLVLVVAGIVLAVLIVVFRAKPHEHTEASRLTGGFSSAVLGEVVTDRDGLKDPRVEKGMIWNRRKGEFIAQGKISDEYLKSLVS